MKYSIKATLPQKLKTKYVLFTASMPSFVELYYSEHEYLNEIPRLRFAHRPNQPTGPLSSYSFRHPIKIWGYRISSEYSGGYALEIKDKQSIEKVMRQGKL